MVRIRIGQISQKIRFFGMSVKPLTNFFDLVVVILAKFFVICLIKPCLLFQRMTLFLPVAGANAMQLDVQGSRAQRFPFMLVEPDAVAGITMVETKIDPMSYLEFKQDMATCRT